MNPRAIWVLKVVGILVLWLVVLLSIDISQRQTIAKMDERIAELKKQVVDGEVKRSRELQEQIEQLRRQFCRAMEYGTCPQEEK